MERKVEHKGYEVVQTDFNNHLSVYKDGRRVMHVPCDTQKTDEELKQVVEDYLVLFSEENIKLYLSTKGIQIEQ